MQAMRCEESANGGEGNWFGMTRKKRLTAFLGYFEVEVWTQTREDGSKAHRVTVGLAYKDQDRPANYQPMEFVVGSADEVLDLFEVALASNELIESLLLSKNAGGGAS